MCRVREDEPITECGGRRPGHDPDSRAIRYNIPEWNPDRVDFWPIPGCARCPVAFAMPLATACHILVVASFAVATTPRSLTGLSPCPTGWGLLRAGWLGWRH